MRVPEPLSTAFGEPFEKLISQFACDQELLPDIEAIRSNRFLSRSVVPHIEKLSSLFNREEKDQAAALEPYWKQSSNPAHLRLAYFLYFMPSNLYRVASVWAELHRLGYQWPEGRPLRGIEFGAGPATGACGIAAGETYAKTGIPPEGNWALIEQDKAMLDLGGKWAQTYFADLKIGDWGIRPFHRKIDLKQGFLPRSAPKFNLWLMSYYLNELEEPADVIAKALATAWDRHLEDEGIVILVEPALKLQSRRLLEVRRELLKLRQEDSRYDWMQILLPCLGHQACGALAAAEDWCHEEVTWWRPPYFRKLDQMAGLDRKTLPFSYLVLTKSKRARGTILPELDGARSHHRLVSPAHAEGKEWEFFVCSDEGKRRARYRPKGEEDPGADLGRGDILSDAQVRGDSNASRIEKFRKKS